MSTSQPRPVRPRVGGPYNVLLVLVDDVGIDLLRAYDDQNHYAKPFPYAATPTLDALAKGGVRFRQCRVSPRCSPTRAQIQTGRYPFRTGIGESVQQVPTPNFALQLSEQTLPKLLKPAGYDCAAIGKWHLGNTTNSGTTNDPDGWQITPTAAGYPHFSGCLYNLNNQPAAVERPDYFQWHRVEDGVGTTEDQYATSRQAEDAIRWIEHAVEPWFLYLAFNAIHGPFNWPPANLHHYGPKPPDQGAGPGVPPAYNTRARAMLEALDAEFGRVLASIPPAVRARTMILLLGDNGTDGATMQISPRDISSLRHPVPPSVAPYDWRRFKNTMYEGGIRVPFLAQGPLVAQPGRTVDHHVNGVDLYRTVLSIASKSSTTMPNLPAIDGVDLLPVLEKPSAPPARSFSFADAFSPNGLPVTGPFSDQRREIRRAYVDSEGFKLIDRRGGSLGTPGELRTEVFNVFEDPLELEALPPEEFQYLFEEMNELLDS